MSKADDVGGNPRIGVSAGLHPICDAKITVVQRVSSDLRCNPHVHGIFSMEFSYPRTPAASPPGSARFEVEPRHPRRLVVDAEDVEVRVVGTRFRVTRTEADGARVEIAVERGIVEVRDHKGNGEPHRLRAGERFSPPALSKDDAAGAPDDDDQAETAPRRTRRTRRAESGAASGKLGRVEADIASSTKARGRIRSRRAPPQKFRTTPACDSSAAPEAPVTTMFASAAACARSGRPAPRPSRSATGDWPSRRSSSSIASA